MHYWRWLGKEKSRIDLTKLVIGFQVDTEIAQPTQAQLIEERRQWENWLGQLRASGIDPDKWLK